MGEIGRDRLGGPGLADGVAAGGLRTTPACMRRGTWTAMARPTIRGTSGHRQYPRARAGINPPFHLPVPATA